MKTMNDNGTFAFPRTLTRDIVRIVLAASAVLLLPLLAMQFTNEVAWGPLDFAVPGVLLVGTGLMYLVFTRKTRQVRHRMAIGLALGAVLVLVWMELAVGIFGTPFAGS